MTLTTPAYHYDIELLQLTLRQLNNCRGDIKAHYAVKANADVQLLGIIADAGLGADCVSGGEIRAAIAAGFKAADIMFAGVGKTDDEIALALDAGIGCFNVESEQELEVIDETARRRGVKARVALRVNPHIDAHTNAKITTGLAENKFGIDMTSLRQVARRAGVMAGIDLIGVQMHIGSQITSMEPYRLMCVKVNEIQSMLADDGITLRMIDLGGGLGVDYQDPGRHPIADFKVWFDTIRHHLRPAPGTTVHVEPGRSVIAQCGTLLSHVLYIKQGLTRRFAIIDAGMNDLMRPALYDAHHRIVSLTPQNDGVTETYDIVGPVCESSDTFATGVVMPELHRGDMLALMSAGAYGQSMASHYNLRPSARVIYSDDDSPEVRYVTDSIRQLRYNYNK